MEDYNERLFGKNIFIKNIHTLRFIWLSKNIKKYCLNVNIFLELGCYVAKTLNYLPKVKNYLGIDANWENGLDIAKNTKHKTQNTNIKLIESSSLIKLSEEFDVSIAMEVLEHLPDEDLAKYIKMLANAKYVFITIPKESGISFFIKYIIKKIIFYPTEKHTFKEFILVSIGKPNKIPRQVGGHKGFDYKKTIELIEEKFEILQVDGLNGPSFFEPLCIRLGIIGKRKTKLQ